MFYARFQVGSGFDIMLRDYEDAKCSNTGKQVGFDGWYANGQAYAYIQGELGIQIKLFFVKKKIPIIKAGAAVLLQVKAPNPIWMRGYVGGHFNLLGGLIKGRFRFKLTIGKECVFEEELPLGGLKIITDVSPDNGIENIDVFAIPQAAFSLKVGEPIIIPEDDGDKTYRIDIEKFTVVHNGKEILGTLEWSTEKDRANFISTDILPPNEEITVRVAVSFKEKMNGIFKPIIIKGKPAIELEERTFTTGGAPSNIPLQNITYAYPVIDQKYFLENEHDKGYVQLKRGQDYLFDNTAWESFISYTKEDKPSEEIAFNYNTTENRVSYTLPNVSQETQYVLEIASRPKRSTNATVVQEEKKENTKSIGSYDQSHKETNIKIKQNNAQNLSREGEIARLSYGFGTSKYKTLKHKINSFSNQDYNWNAIFSDVIYLTNKVHDHEPFDITELIGSTYTENIPLVGIEATLDDTYFTSDINPPLYAKYPLGGKYTFKNRQSQTLGVPPKYALPLQSNYLTNLEYEVNEQMLRTTFPFRYNVGLVYKQDWVDLQSQIVNDYIDGLISNGSTLLNFLDAEYLFMRYGFYNTTVQYTVPGGINGTSAIYKFKNPNKFRN
jgi:hypothetical protein